MFFDVAQQPQRLRMCQWDGSNVDEVQAYMDSVDDSGGREKVIVRDDGSAYIDSYGTEKPLVPGSLVYAVWAPWASPTVTVYSPTEANVWLYPYPEFDPVLTDPSANTTTGTE